ncbi:hypothetical protein [Deinococcus sp. Leaf326]|uniref:hypothetical protein n=1 Tax=Deinococcus sp. Leaf326 TaxID=1736338 RepID=UPI0006FE5839|nr:hypothetical protein [Deinococcus sp. Leaf326]KQR27273.1 hypothetical protein ASF71_17785 [Deinococcus sp. Leaf326]
MKRLPSTALLLALLAPALNACAPTLSSATLALSPASLQLRQGSRATVRVVFQRYVYGDEALEGYRLFVFGSGQGGLRILDATAALKARDTATFTVEAARNADLGRQRVVVMVSDPRGKGNLQRTLELNVVP